MDAGFIFLVRFAFLAILLPILALVFLSVNLFFTSMGAKHWLILATTLPDRGPLPQRYLRTTFLPVRAQTLFSSTVDKISLNNMQLFIEIKVLAVLPTQ